MRSYDLPTEAEIGGVSYDIRSDYRAVIDIFGVMADIALDDEERAFLVLSIFYPDFDEMPRGIWQDALNYVFWFVNGGEDPERDRRKKPKLMDWEQDFPLIIAPVNRIAGCEVRALDYLHWWTFLAYYREIDGDCMFAQVVSIRRKRKRGEKLDKNDQKFYRENRSLIEFANSYTDEENELLDMMAGKQNG